MRNVISIFKNSFFFIVPKPGYGFKSGQVRKTGNFLLGPILGSLPVRSMIQCLGRKKGTGMLLNIISIKILILALLQNMNLKTKYFSLVDISLYIENIYYTRK